MGFQHMTPERRAEVARRGGAIGGAIRAKSFTSASQSAASRAQSSAHKRRAGAKGFAAAAAKYGPTWVAKLAADWRRNNPNKWERAVAADLDKLQFAYDREVLIGDVYADFLLRDVPAVIEVDHPKWHTNNDLHGEDREGRDRYKDAVYAKAGLLIIRLDPVAIKTGTAFARLDRELHALALGPAHSS